MAYYNKKYQKPKQKLKSNKQKKKSNTDTKLKLSKNYRDTSSYNNDNVILKLSQLRYGIIDSCIVTTVQLPDGAITLKDSWIEFLIISIDTIIENEKDNILDVLEKNEITNQFLIVDKVYGKYDLDGHNYKAYKIYDKNYYLESTFTSDVIYHALVGIVKYLGISTDDIKFIVRNKQQIVFESNFKNTRDNEQIVYIDYLKRGLKKNEKLTSIVILENNVKLNSIEELLMIFCKIVYNTEGENGLLLLDHHGNTGITVNSLLYSDDIKSTHIPNSNFSVYTDGNYKDIVLFIINAMQLLDIPKEELLIKVSKKGNTNKKEWEYD